MTTNEKVELENLPNDNIEIRYFDDDQCRGYRSWKITEAVPRELTSWWRESRKKSKKRFSLRDKMDVCEFIMLNEEHIDIHALGSLGRRSMMSWSFPIEVVEKLAQECA